MEGILWLDEILPQLYDSVGHKAAYLARLQSNGYVIPRGFVITYELLMSRTRQQWEEALAEALLSLQGPWAVRSSSSVEDSTNLAFPGLFKTILGLTSVSSVADAIEQVVSSISSDAVLAYARHHGLQVNNFRMAVLIQHMLNPQASGVAFSRHPTESRDLVAIDATYGLGAPLVDGKIDPDQIHVDEERRVTFVRVGSKKIRAVFVNDQVRYETPNEDDCRRPAITIREARVIADMARQLEKTLGEPQDIEWAIVDHQLYLLQSRPITTFFNE